MNNAAMKMTGLTPRQLLFIDKYFELKFDKAEAYLRAYPRVKVRETAHAAASRLLHNVRVSEEVERRQAFLRETNKATVDLIREELECLAFSNIGDYLTFGPGYVTLKDTSDLTPEQLAPVSEVTETATEHGGSVRFKLHSKIKALELLMKYYGLIIEKKEVFGRDGTPIGTGYVNMKEIVEGIWQTQRPKTLWNEGP